MLSSYFCTAPQILCVIIFLTTNVICDETEKSICVDQILRVFKGTKSGVEHISFAFRELTINDFCLTSNKYAADYYNYLHTKIKEGEVKEPFVHSGSSDERCKDVQYSLRVGSILSILNDAFGDTVIDAINQAYYNHRIETITERIPSYKALYVKNQYLKHISDNITTDDHVYDPEEYCSSIYNEKKKKTFEETGESSNSIGKSHNTSEN